MTGGTGFTGANLVFSHIFKGDKMTIITRKERALLDSSYDALQLSTYHAKLINVVQGNITDENLISRVLVDYDIERIYHLAGQTIVSRAMDCPRSFYETNVMGTLSLLEAVRKTKSTIPVLVTATDKVYGDNDLEQYEESMPINPKSIYDSSKAMEDILSRTYAKVYDMPVVVTRAGNIYGPADFNPRIIPNTILSCIKGKNPILYGGIKNKRDYVFVQDVIDAYDKLLDLIYLTRRNAYNVGTCTGKTPEEVVHEILNYFPTLRVIYKDPKSYMLDEIKDQVSCYDKIKRDIGWKPKYSFEGGIKLTVLWYEWFMKEYNYV